MIITIATHTLQHSRTYIIKTDRTIFRKYEIQIIHEK